MMEGEGVPKSRNNFVKHFIFAEMVGDEVTIKEAKS